VCRLALANDEPAPDWGVRVKNRRDVRKIAGVTRLS
jgi:hypothetical protein